MTVHAPRGISRELTLLLAVACGVTVANNYYAQPLLEAMATTFGVGAGAAGLIVTVGQIGYAAGLVLIVPLGDMLDRRRLLAILLSVCVVALVAAAAAPHLAWLGAAALIASATSVVAQILVPFAATLAGDRDRGRVVGTVMSGLLLGILLARTAAGLIAELGGWRAVYLVAAGLVASVGLVLVRRLPQSAPTARIGYRALLATVWRLVVEEPTLRRRAVYGALTFGAFGALWTTLAFLLSRAPYGYSEGTIGAFGLFGLAGALAASRVGRWHDRGLGHAATGTMLGLGAAGFALIALGRESLAALIAGIVLMDLAVQAVQILNQSTVYALRPDARSRLTTAYMTAYFTGGAVGSALGVTAYAAGGWVASSALGGGAFLAGLAFWLTEPRR